MGLVLYRKKRRFNETPEPSTGKEKSSSRLKFVIQRHHASRLHYDFRLEMDGVLKSWAVPKGPSLVAGERRLAVHVEDHPLAYGKFYGEIPEGNYGAGIVEIWDNGTYEPLEPEKGTSGEKLLLRQYHKGDLKFVLKGKHLNGAFALVRMRDETGNNWLLIKKSDEHARKSYDIAAIDPVKPYNKDTKHKREWKSNRTSDNGKTDTGDEAGKEDDSPADGTIGITTAWETLHRPMLATLAANERDDPEWVYEPKYDGYRAVTKISKNKVEIVSRNGNSFNKAYAPLIPELEHFGDELILDGEIVIEDEKGVSNFQLLQNYATTRRGTLRYYVFDLLYLNGHAIVHLPLHQRRELLGAVFAKTTLENVQLSPFVAEKGAELMKKLSGLGYEGIIAKNRNSSYIPGRRSDTWLKYKIVRSTEAIICGYTAPRNSRKFFGSLVLGMYDDGQLVYIGNCGSGFTETSLRELHAKFEKLVVKTMPFAGKPALKHPKSAFTWLEPKLVCNVKFANWTDDGHLRVPVFQGLRTDKKASEVMKNNDTQPDTAKKPKTKDAGNSTASEEKDRELKINGHVLRVTNLGKIYFPDDKITKGDIIGYYRAIAPMILPYLKNRPQSLNRHPDGIAKPGFYQKDMNTEQIPDWLQTEKMYSKSNEAYLDYLICNNEATLVYMANLGCIEINPWHSTFDRPDHPDYMIMDLDPGEIGFGEVVTTAQTIKEICDELSVPCYCKTSGATGLHIYIPLRKRYDYDEVKLFGELLATAAHNRLPDTTSIERTVSKRKDKIYIDFLQNRKGQTIAAPYSVRPKPGGTVSTPLHWEEVNQRLDPKDFTIHTIHDRLKKVGDLWKPVLGKGADIGKALTKLEELL